MALTLEAWILWRTSGSAPDADGGIALGQGDDTSDLTTLEDPQPAWTIAIQTAFHRSRCFRGAMLRMATLEEKFADALAKRFPDGSTSSALWLIVASDIGPCLLAGCAFGGPPPEEADVAAALRVSLGETPAPDLSAAFKAAAPKNLGRLENLAIRHDRTHLVACYLDGGELLRHGDVSRTLYTESHGFEEGDVTNQSADYRFEGSSLAYAHVGWDYTTFAAARFSDIVFLLPSCVMAQLSWAAQRAFEDALRERKWRPSADTTAALSLKTFENVKLELKLLEIDRQAFREALRPWQQRLFDRFVDVWHIDGSSRLSQEATERIASYLNARVQVRTLEANDRQSFILNVVALLGVLGLASTAASYVDLLQHFDRVQHIAATPPYLVAVAVLFGLTVLLTIYGIVFGLRPRP
jgi:hypothetical protein